MTNEEIKKYFCKPDDLWKVLYKFEADIKQNEDKLLDSADEDDYKNTASILQALKGSYKQKIFVKLNYIFRLQLPLSDSEAEMFYNDQENFTFIYDRYKLYYNIIEYINNEMDILYIPDKMTTCAFFRISPDMWTTFLNYGNLNDSRVKGIFESIESFLISSITTGVENGQLNKQAWRKLELKGKYGGNDVEYSVNNQQGNQSVLTAISNKHQELENKLKGKYNFIIEAPAEIKEQ